MGACARENSRLALDDPEKVGSRTVSSTVWHRHPGQRVRRSERVIPLNAHVADALIVYTQAQGVVFERVRTCGLRANIRKPLSPHRLRHTLATIRDLLGHRLITSTQINLHVSAQYLRQAADRHPIKSLLGTIVHVIPNASLPFQQVAGLRRYGQFLTIDPEKSPSRGAAHHRDVSQW